MPVLIHDDTLDRTTDGQGLVSTRSFAELRALDAGGTAFEGRFTGERIPSLGQVIDAVHGRCLLLVEIKQPEIAPIVVDLLRRTDALAWSMIWSFHLQTVVAARALEPRLPVALLSPPLHGPPESLLATAQSHGFAGVSVHYTSIDAGLVQAAHGQGLQVYTWTVDSPADQRRVAAAGVDGIVSNVPAVLREAMASA